MPKVSVIIPTYNRPASLLCALESVFVQTYQDFEVIVVEDGSLTSTKDEIVRYGNRVRYFWQNNAGVAAARNRGIRESKGEYIAFLDDDDVWVGEDKLSVQIDVLECNDKVGLVYGKMSMVDSSGRQYAIKPENTVGPTFKELIEVGGHIPTSTVLVRKKCFEKASYFDESFSVFEDFDMWLRISRFYDIYESGNRIFGYYCKDSSASRDRVLVLGSKVRLVKKILNNFDDVPGKILLRDLNENIYLLSRAYFEKKCFSQSLSNLKEALCRDLFVGRCFFSKADNLALKFKKIIKPYLFLLACLINLFLPRKLRHTE